MAEINGVSLDSMISIGDLVKRLGPRDRTRILKAITKPEVKIEREEWAGAARMLAGNAGRGDHAKFAKVMVVYLGSNDEMKSNVDQFIASHGEAKKQRGRPRKES